jgi:hypothetical protein
MLDCGLNLRPFDKLPPSHEASSFAKATADKTVGRHGRQAQARECGAEKRNFYSFCVFIARPKGSWQSRDRFTQAIVRDDKAVVIARPEGSWQSRDRFTRVTVRDDTLDLRLCNFPLDENLKKTGCKGSISPLHPVLYISYSNLF